MGLKKDTSKGVLEESNTAMLGQQKQEFFQVQLIDSSSQQFLLPSADAPDADIQVSTFRRWYDTFGGQVPTCSQADMDAVAQPLPKEQVR